MNSPLSTSQQIEAAYRQALSLHEQGQLARAQILYLEILQAQPAHADALHLLGVLAHQAGQPERGVELIGKAIQANSAQPVFFYNHGNALTALGRLEAAVASYIQAVRLQPRFAEAYASLGGAFLALKQLDHALTAFDRALALKPGAADWHFSRGNVLIEVHQPEAALASFDSAIALKLDFAEAHANRGKALLEGKQWGAAVESCDRAIAIKPELAEAYVGRGHALQALGHLDAALSDFDRAIQLNPQLAEAHHNRARALQELKRLDEALASFDTAVELSPNNAEAHCNRGNALQELRRYADASVSYERAIQLRPEYPEAFANRGIVLQKSNRVAAAAKDFSKAIELKPDYEFLLGTYLHANMCMANWRDFDRGVSELSRRIARFEKASPSFPVLSLTGSPALQKSASQIWAHALHPPLDSLGPIPRRVDHRKIRIGYFSGDFHDHHPVALLTVNMFECHDKSRFELTAFSYGLDQNDEMRHRLAAAFDRFVNVGALSDMEVAQLSRKLEIDIAIDLMGFTQGFRCDIFASRSAPVQVNYLGYPGTMGTEYFDYVIADETVIPAENRQYHTEKIAYLPNTFFVNDGRREIPAKKWTRAELGLPAVGFVFCSFNNVYKILPNWFDRWMRLLKAIDGSVLWLAQVNHAAVDNLRREAQQRGVDPQRLIFARRLPSLADHLARYRLADLFLDTLPYNAHTTASDALWAGLPVLTCLGQSFASRVATSLLKAVHLPEMITRTPEEYEALALELATQPSKLAAIREKLDRNRLSAPLFDTPLFTRHLEAAYEAMWERYLAGQAPDHIRVPAELPAR
jgi:predicted O-linked N-acetylglucosamine transferase (SPINDLY family)